MNEIKPITTNQLDSILRGKPEKLWGAPAVAAAAGVSVDTIYRWAKNSSIPVYRRGGRYFAIRSELEQWLRSAA